MIIEKQRVLEKRKKEMIRKQKEDREYFRRKQEEKRLKVANKLKTFEKIQNEKMKAVE